MLLKLTPDGIKVIMFAMQRQNNGETKGLEFTKISIGNGKDASLNDWKEGKSELGFCKISNKIVDINIESIQKISESSYVTLVGSFNNADIDSRFHCTEYGVYVTDFENENNTELLFAYAYVDNEAATIIPAVTDYYFKTTDTLSIYIGEIENISAILSKNQTYASKEEFNNHLSNFNNPHKVTAKQIGLGNVVNSSPSDAVPEFDEANRLENVTSGEKTSTLWGKVQKAISSLLNHMADRNNPHNVTTTQIGAAKTSHKHSAYDITSGVLGVERGGTGVTTIENLKYQLQDNMVNYRDNISFASNVFNVYSEGFWKQNNTAFIFATFQLRDKLSGNPDCLICTLPRGLRPISQICVICQTNEQGNTPTVSIQFNTNGQVKLYSFGHLELPEKAFYRFTATYPTAE